MFYVLPNCFPEHAGEHFYYQCMSVGPLSLLGQFVSEFRISWLRYVQKVPEGNVEKLPYLMPMSADWQAFLFSS